MLKKEGLETHGGALGDEISRASHAENFSLKDFFGVRGGALTERIAPFSRFLEAQREGAALYSREVLGPADRRVLVRDALSGKPREMLMFGSNNYLGLANHPDVKLAVKRAVDSHGAGMGGPPLLNGMSDLHRSLEQRLAKLKGAEDALLFASGFQANLGWVTGLLREGDVLFYDELNHASLYDAIKLAGAGHSRDSKIKAIRFRHNDCSKLLTLLETTRAEGGCPGQIFVAVEGVYSMDGDLAPLRELRELCDRFDALLVVDDAHGTGVMGRTGGGTAQHFGLEGRVDLAMGTFSKAFGTTGGFLAGKREVISYLRFFARSYMFSAHLAPPVVATVLAGLDVIAREPERIAQVHENASYLQARLNELGFKIERGAAILPIPVPASVDIRVLARRFHDEGIFLNSVEYPAVARNAQRLRVSVMATHTREDLDRAVAVFKMLGEEFGLIR